MEAIEKLENNRVYVFGKRAALATTALAYWATGSLTAAVTAVGLSILAVSGTLTSAVQPKARSIVKLTISALLATITAIAYLSFGGLPILAGEVAYIASLLLIPTLGEIGIEFVKNIFSLGQSSEKTHRKDFIEAWNQRLNYNEDKRAKGQEKINEL